MTYKFKAINSFGGIVTSNLTAPTKDDAKSSLHSVGYLVLCLKEKKERRSEIKLGFKRRPSDGEMSVFCRQAAALLRAGITVSDAILYLSEMTSSSCLAGALCEMLSDLRRGIRLSEAMKSRRDVFPEIMICAAASGEASGNLEHSFSRMEDYFRERNKTRKSIENALAYPAVLLAFMTAVIFAMLAFVIPEISDMLEEMGAELPSVTRAVIAVSGFISSNALPLFAAAAALAGIFTAISKIDAVKRFFDVMLLRLPIISKCSENYATAEFCRTMSFLLGAGLPIVDALGLTASGMRNSCFGGAVRKTAEMVKNGSELSAAIRSAGVFPKLLSDAAYIGENSGNIPGLLGGLSEFYDEEIKSFSAKLTSIIEPAVIIIMSAAVFLVVLSVFLPLLGVTDAIGELI